MLSYWPSTRQMTVPYLDRVGRLSTSFARVIHQQSSGPSPSCRRSNRTSTDRPISLEGSEVCGAYCSLSEAQGTEPLGSVDAGVHNTKLMREEVTMRQYCGRDRVLHPQFPRISVDTCQGRGAVRFCNMRSYKIKVRPQDGLETPLKGDQSRMLF
jgi:hypothetical protein